jgi:Zinc finger, C2H2 type
MCTCTEKPYECEICHHKFTQSNSMKAHRMIHEAIKPVFQCSLCPTKCSRKTDLKIHVQKLHQSDQPVVCKKCSKSFADRYLFNVHRKNDVECSGKKSATASPKKRNKKNQKKRGASASSDTTSDEDVPSASEEEDTMMEESQADVEGGFHSVRCVLPDGGVVHIIHNGGTNESDTTRVVALTSAQMAEFQSHSSESQAEAIPPVSLTDNDGGSTQGTIFETDLSEACFSLQSQFFSYFSEIYISKNFATNVEGCHFLTRYPMFTS